METAPEAIRVATGPDKGAGLDALCALSSVLDIYNGCDEEKSQYCAAFALTLAADAGLTIAQQADAYLTGLMLHLGCTGYAVFENRIVSDDIALRSAVMRNPGSLLALATALVRSNTGIGSRLAAFLEIGRHFKSYRSGWFQEACGAGKSLSAQLGFRPELIDAISNIYERWDGSGGPAGKRGDALPVVSRIAHAAHTASLLFLDGGVDHAQAGLRHASGTKVDPQWAQRAMALLPLMSDPALLSGAAAVIRSAPVAPLDPMQIAQVFGDYADLQMSTFSGHSRAVAALTARSADLLGIDASNRVALLQAAHLHDIGQTSLPTRLWLLPRAWRASERRRAESHVSVTARVLASAPCFQAVAQIAGDHHERLDGSGYPRRATGALLDLPSRLLAVADVASGLREGRPHRPARSIAQVLDHLNQQVQDGRLDAQCVAAVGAALEQRDHIVRSGAPQLTEREFDVLRELAKGLRNKEIGRALGISDRTVQTHTVNIYRKLGVDSRAAAVLAASRLGHLQP